MNQFFKTEDQIIAWLEKMEISNYRLLPQPEYGFVVDVGGNVDLRNKKLKAIPIKFNEIEGDFFCGSNKLTSLAGCPSTVLGSFNCDDNCLASLMHCPSNVKGYFSCDGNKLKNLQHVPVRITSDFYCANNNLTTLEYCPHFVYGCFHCYNNPIENLEFCPSMVRDTFDCSDTNLGEASEITDFKEIYKIHQDYLNIKTEQKLLNDVIKPGGKSDKSYKI